MSGCTSQPNLNSIVHALRNAPRSTGLMWLLNDYPYTGKRYASITPWTHLLHLQCRSISPPNARRQYTNQRAGNCTWFGKRWPDVVKTSGGQSTTWGWSKVSSGKCVGDLAIFLITKGLNRKIWSTCHQRQDFRVCN